MESDKIIKTEMAVRLKFPNVAQHNTLENEGENIGLPTNFQKQISERLTCQECIEKSQFTLDLQSRFQKLEEENQQIEKINRKNCKQIDSLEKEKLMLYGQLDTTQQRNEELTKTNEDDHNEIKLLQDENTKLKAIVENYEERLDSAGELNDELTEREQDVKQLTNDYVAMKTQLQEEIDVYKKEMEGQLFIY